MYMCSTAGSVLVGNRAAQSLPSHQHKTPQQLRLLSWWYFTKYVNCARFLQSLVGHKGVINDLCTHPSDETLLASVGDDCVCRIWDLQQGQQRSEFKLGSPGMSVRWHECDPVKVGVVISCQGGCGHLLSRWVWSSLWSGPKSDWFWPVHHCSTHTLAGYSPPLIRLDFIS